MKAIDALRTFCPIRGAQTQQVGDQFKVFNRKCSPGACNWWTWWPSSEESQGDDRHGSCVVHDIAAAIENLPAGG